MWLTRITLCAVVLVAVTALNLEEPLERDEIIDAVNSAKTTWTAGRNFHPLATKKYTKSLLGIKRPVNRKPQPKYVPDYEYVDLPKNFDSRQKWSFCKALQTVRDQGDCGSCWAVSSTAVFTNRLCIASNGSWNGYLAAQQTVSCSEDSDGCEGGWPESAFEYFRDTGLVTGGDYHSSVGCQPYLLPHCEHHNITGKYKPCGDTYKVAPACQHKCYNKKYKTPYAKDFHKSKQAVSSTAVFTNRLCIASNGSWNGYLAAQQTVSCSQESDGCEGGWPESAFEYFRDTGLVTGGDYHSRVGCQPYLLPHCEHHNITGKYKPCGDTYKVAPACQHKCYNKKYKTPYAKDFHKIKSVFNLSGIKQIQQEIYKNGPVVAVFTVYEDFVSYKSGVYQHTTGEVLGGHAVQIIGWGEENGTPYWLIANQWNSDFGDKGTIKFIRGKDDCGIEDEISGGLAAV